MKAKRQSILKTSWIEVFEKKLGRHGNKKDLMYLGFFYGEKEKAIEIDPRLCPRQYLKIIIHEIIHYLHPEFSEKKVVRAANKITEALWKLNYRKVNQ